MIGRRHLAARLAARVGICLAIAGAAVPTLGVGPAAACSCASAASDAQYRQAGAVFTGTLVRREEPRAGETMQSSTYPAVYTFAVDRVHKGEITDPQRVVSYVSGASCGLELQGTGPFVVFTSRRDDNVPGEGFPAEYADLPRAFLCGGTRALEAGEEPFGPGRTPSPAAAPVTDTTTTLGPTSDDAGGGDGVSTPITLGLGVAAVALIAGGFVLRRHGRH